MIGAEHVISDSTAPLAGLSSHQSCNVRLEMLPATAQVWRESQIDWITHEIDIAPRLARQGLLSLPTGVDDLQVLPLTRRHPSYYQDL